MAFFQTAVGLDLPAEELAKAERTLQMLVPDQAPARVAEASNLNLKAEAVGHQKRAASKPWLASV
jgi:hypothetical protein